MVEIFQDLQQAVTLIDSDTIYSHDVLDSPKRGRRIGHCLDTRSCPEGPLFARDADVLLYDSTLAPGAEQEATEKGHSTSRQAAVLAKEAGVKRLVLTHISARYTSARELLTGLEGLHDDFVLARDLMELSV